MRAQFVANLAAFDVLAYILIGDKDFKLQTWPRKAKRRVRKLWQQSEDVHPLLDAELQGYFILSDIEVAKPKRPGRKGVTQDQRQLKLPLDRELYRTIYRELPNPVSIYRRRR